MLKVGFIIIKMSSIEKSKNVCLLNIIDEFVTLRSTIQNNHNGHSKLGCLAFSTKLKQPRILCFWI
jgi:hypothetical protein